MFALRDKSYSNIYRFFFLYSLFGVLLLDSEGALFSCFGIVVEIDHLSNDLI
jgi:hypothetical protein